MKYMLSWLALGTSCVYLKSSALYLSLKLPWNPSHQTAILTSCAGGSLQVRRGHVVTHDLLHKCCTRFPTTACPPPQATKKYFLHESSSEGSIHCFKSLTISFNIDYELIVNPRFKCTALERKQQMRFIFCACMCGNFYSTQIFEYNTLLLVFIILSRSFKEKKS